MKRHSVLIILLFIMIFGLRFGEAQTPDEKPAVARIDPALDTIIPSDA